MWKSEGHNITLNWKGRKTIKRSSLSETNVTREFMKTRRGAPVTGEMETEPVQDYACGVSWLITTSRDLLAAAA